jgi:hypothetical protein
VDAAAYPMVPNAAPTGATAGLELSALAAQVVLRGAASAMAPIRRDARTGVNAQQATAASGPSEKEGRDASKAMMIMYATLEATARRGKSAEKAGATVGDRLGHDFG